MAKSDAERQRASRERRKERGLTQVSLYLSSETLRAIDRLKGQDQYGSREAVITAAVRKLRSKKA